MTWSYSGDPSASTMDELRFLIQDIDYEDQLLQDEELDYLITKYLDDKGSIYYPAAVAAEVLASRFAREVSYSADGVSVQTSELQNKYDQLAAYLRERYKSDRKGGPDAGGILFGETLDFSINPLMFSNGMHDNVWAGQQDYGGQQNRPETEYPYQW